MPSTSGYQGFVEPEPTPAQVIAGLRATVEDNPVQLLTPEGERVADPRWDRWIADIDGGGDSADIDDGGDSADIDDGGDSVGRSDGGVGGRTGVEALCGLYRDMVLVRRADREANALQRQGQLGIWVPLLGQEAAQIGAGRALRATDMAFPSYREHGVAWTRGIDPTDLLGIFRGTDHGSWDPIATGFHLYTIVIGNQCLNATGYAMGQRFDGKVGDTDNGEATICFFGDGATSQGDVHEGFVWSAVYDAPVVFFCQNNQWAISEPLERQTRVPLYQRARGYGFPGIRVDGNDVLATLAVTRWALEECRTGNGPVLIEAFTYRMDAHTTSDDPSRYRLADELELWKLKDPIERLRVNLVREHQVGQDYFDGIQAESDALAARLREFCVNMPKPGPERIFSEVYAELSPPLQAQREEYLAYLGTLE